MEHKRAPDQNGVSRLYNLLEIYHSGPEPSKIILLLFSLILLFYLSYLKKKKFNTRISKTRAVLKHQRAKHDYYFTGELDSGSMNSGYTVDDQRFWPDGGNTLFGTICRDTVRALRDCVSHANVGAVGLQ